MEAPEPGGVVNYAIRWVGIKAKYELSVNEQEKAELVEMLDACRGGER